MRTDQPQVSTTLQESARGGSLPGLLICASAHYKCALAMGKLLPGLCITSAS